jgi:RNA polymerase sigma-70 factor (ECF subfamily)
MKAPAISFEDEISAEKRPSSASETDVEALRRDAARQVRGVLNELPGDQMRVIELAYFGGLTHSQIAETLGMPLGTVKGRMRLGMEKIRARLAEQV